MSNAVSKKKAKKTESVLTTCKLFVGVVLDYIVCVYMLLVIAVMPFYFHWEEGYKTIGTSKYHFFRWLIEHIGLFFIPVLIVFLIIASIEYLKQSKGDLRSGWKQLFKKIHYVDVFALLYGLSLIVSYVASPYKETALWGVNGWYMGLIPQLTSVIVYFSISRLWKRRSWVFGLILPVSAVVFLLGVLNRFGIYPIDMRMQLPLFISTIGNINWFCGYLVSVFLAGVYLLWKKPETDVAFKLILIYVLIGFASLVTQGSLSGLMAMGIVFLFLFYESAKSDRLMERFWLIAFLFSLVCLAIYGVRQVWPDAMTFTDGVIDLLTDSFLPVLMVIVSGAVLWIVHGSIRKNHYSIRLFKTLAVGAICVCIIIFAVIVGMIVWNTGHPGSLGKLSEYSLFTFSPAWGSNRGATWEVGVLCLKEMSGWQKIIGIGPDCMEAFISDIANLQINSVIQERFEGLRLTNAHCELLNIAINMGFFGLISFAGMMFSAICSYLRNSSKQTLIAGACGLCLLAYMTNNLVSFEQSMSLATIYVVLGIGRAYTMEDVQ